MTTMAALSFHCSMQFFSLFVYALQLRIKREPNYERKGTFIRGFKKPERLAQQTGTFQDLGRHSSGSLIP